MATHPSHPLTKTRSASSETLPPVSRAPTMSEEKDIEMRKSANGGQGSIESAGQTIGGQAALDMQPEMEYPEGGARAYLTTLGGGIMLFATFGLTNSFGVFQSQYQEGLLRNYSPSQISWIGSTNLCLLFLLGLPAGRLFDAGYFRHLMIAGTVLSLVGVFTLSVCTEYWQIFLAYSICMGTAGALIFSPVASCVGSYFLKKRGLMIGSAVAMAALGAVVFPLLLNPLFLSIGFPQTVRVAGYLSLGCFAVANILMRPRVLLKKAQPPLLPQMKAFLSEPSTWLISLGIGLPVAANWIVLFYLQTFMEKEDLGPTLVKYGLSITNSTAVIGRLAVGVLADRFGSLNCQIGCAVALGVLAMAMIGATNVPGAVIWMLLYGLSSGGLVALMSPSILTLAKDASEFGARIGLGFLFIAMCTLIGTPVAGALLSAAGGYWAPCLFAFLLAMLGTGGLAASRVLVSRRKGTWKV